MKKRSKQESAELFPPPSNIRPMHVGVEGDAVHCMALDKNGWQLIITF